MSQGQQRIVPLNHIEEAVILFTRLLVPVVIDVRGEPVFFDMGDYVHVMDDSERLRRIRWIRETLTHPDEIRRSHLASKPFRELYVARIWESEDDQTGETFLVGVDRRFGRLDFRTAFVPMPSYLRQVREGRQLWPV
ncbi:MAG: hypothetical protein HY709_10950, partial [Candidatus Latescibacteria bacterium]|nr:hypothetical protein [Candidatus Latescibacterota bacterium]